MVISVVDVEKTSRFVRAARKPRSVVGDEQTNGGLWCSPVAKTSSPTSSTFSAIATVAMIRSCSVGVRPVVGSGVMSPTEKIPNCIALTPRSFQVAGRAAAQVVERLSY